MRSIAVTSGKGGVGKTNISANLGLAIASLGRRVIVFDADLGLANLDVVLGARAEHTLQSVVSGEKRLAEVVSSGPGGLRFIAGGSGIEALVNLSGQQLDRFLTELNDLQNETDVLIFDTGAGIDRSVMTFAFASDEVLLITTPDPASITDAYATAKGIFNEKRDATIRVVMNMVNDEVQGRAVFAKIQAITQQFLKKTLIFGGFVRHDPVLVECVRKRTPFYLSDKHSKAASDIKSIAGLVIGERVEAASSTSFMDRLFGAFRGEKQKIA